MGRLITGSEPARCPLGVGRNPRKVGSPLWRITVQTSLEAEEAVAELFRSRFRAEPSSYTDAETGLVAVAVYLDRRPDWSAAGRKKFKTSLAQLRGCGLDVGTGRVSLSKVPGQNWAESWKRHFPCLEIGRALLLKPGWSRRRPHPGQQTIVLDPGLSFGTGHHPTTAYCLAQIVAHRVPGTAQSFLDLGTGSGILAIAAARLGYAPVAALDLDPLAVRIARANARRNGLARNIRFSVQDVQKLSRFVQPPASLVSANLVTDLLLSQRRRILGCVARGGRLVTAGILTQEFPAVRAAYTSVGLRLLSSRAVGEWCSGTFARPEGKPSTCNR